jgi:hypothetical protein
LKRKKKFNHGRKATTDHIDRTDRNTDKRKRGNRNVESNRRFAARSKPAR